MDDLRGRARQRLIGALALVVAAVIVVPMLVNTESEQQPETPVVVPAVPPVPEPSVAAGQPGIEPQAGQGGEAPSVETPALPVPEPVAPDEPTASAPRAPAPEQAPKPQPEQAKPEQAKPEPKPAEQAQSKPSSKPDERTDDGSVAIALLEGRKPAAGTSSSPAASQQGSYVLQIAAYTSEKDAQSRRDKLAASGVTNAYVESATSGGKATHRLRVGPFPTREAAQAAQTRLRALGYDNSFISTK